MSEETAENAERGAELLPCPWCGETPGMTEHHKGGMWSMIHRCTVFGPIMIDWTDKDIIQRRWNTRPTTDTVERAAVEKIVHDFDQSGGALEVWQRDQLLGLIRALPSATGGEGE